MVALDRRGDREPHTGVAAGSFDDRATRPELPAPFGFLDNRESDPVLDRAARVGVFGLAIDRSGHTRANLAEADERRPADGLEDGAVRLEMLRRHGVVPPRSG